MTITFSYNKSEQNRLFKSLVPLLTLSGSLRDGASITDPVIMVDGLDQNVTVSGTTYNVLAYTNYAYIPDFDRKYFVKDIKTDANGLFMVSMHCDVLSSRADEVQAQTAIIRRQERSNAYNTYLDDGCFRTYSNPVIETKTFPNGLTQEEFILAVAGSY